MTKLVLERAWAWELPRLPDGLDTVVLTDDPAVVYVLGNIGSNGVLRAIDARTGERIRDAWMPVFVRSYGGVVVSRPSPDKTVVVAIAPDSRATLLEVNLVAGTYRYVATFPWHPWQIERLDDGRLLIDGGVLLDPRAPGVALDGLRRWRSRDLRHEIREEPAEAKTYPRVRLHAYTDGGARWVSPSVQGEGRRGVFSHDGRYFWRVSTNAVRILGDPVERWNVPTGEVGGARSVPRESWCAATRDDDGDPLWCDERGAPINPSAVTDAAKSEARWHPVAACVSPDGRRFVQCSNGHLRETDLTTGLTLLPEGRSGAVTALAASINSAQIASGTLDSAITLWSAATGEKDWQFEGGAGAVKQLAFSPDGRFLYALIADDSQRASLRAWSLAEGTEVTPSRLECSAHARLAVSPDGTRALASSGARPCVPAWIDLMQWRVRKVSEAEITENPRVRHDSSFEGSGRFSNDGRRVLLRCSKDRDVWRVELSASDGRVRSVSRLSPPEASTGGAESATWVAMPNATAGLTLLERATKRKAAELTTTSPVTALAFAGDESRLLVGLADGGVAVMQIVR